MKLWITLGVIALVLVFAGITTINAVTTDSSTDTEQTDALSCGTTCGNSCTLENNCGRATCGAVSSGSCGCR
ncbi:hypothetical protein HN832_04040 [archaeon]|jgi:hypothetical protein|nr:hypothetical protein [archaeon]MBT4373435.1 hypothetical protein [archaeon]MBT4531883.1 hypothetical protein [archaeon]MBT7001550.1 hypothetical protein [archaeon]MBT7282558.1 hypothetical protein [archaeon]